MDQVRDGLRAYLAETSLHGLKYLQLRNGRILQFLWVSLKIRQIQQYVAYVLRTYVVLCIQLYLRRV